MTRAKRSRRDGRAFHPSNLLVERYVLILSLSQSFVKQLCMLICDGKIGDGYCFHGDFINGWFEDAALTMLKAKGQGFMRIDGAHGLGKVPFGSTGCKTQDRDPENGTDDYHKSLEMMDGNMK